MSKISLINLNIFSMNVMTLGEEIAEIEEVNKPITDIQNGQSRDFADNLTCYPTISSFSRAIQTLRQSPSTMFTD